MPLCRYDAEVKSLVAQQSAWQRFESARGSGERRRGGIRLLAAARRCVPPTHPPGCSSDTLGAQRILHSPTHLLSSSPASFPAVLPQTSASRGCCQASSPRRCDWAGRGKASSATGCPNSAAWMASALCRSLRGAW